MKKNFSPTEPSSMSSQELGRILRRFKNLKFTEKIYLIENLAKTEDTLIEKVIYDISKIYYGQD